jgi:copper chaperone CopZ
MKNMELNQNKKIITALSSLLLGVFLVGQAYAASVQRSNFIVENLSCTSCLATIEAELKGVTGVLGMDADLRQGRVTVDHLSSLDYEQIAANISNLGYPARVDWTATVPEKSSNKFAGESNYRSGCSSGGCGVSGGAGAGQTAWKAAPTTGTISRTTLQVSNLSCTSCLNTIADELRTIPETYGMDAYLSRGVVIVDHASTYDNAKIASTISGLGYPAKVVSSNEIPAQKAFSTTKDNGSPNQVARSGSGCNTKGPCNATSTSWQQLYNRYFTQTNSK